jgi:hypothetical protein
MIVHLEHTIEMQDLVLEERAVTIATLKQQLQVLQPQVPLSYPVFMPKPSTHHMHDPGSIVPHI